MITSLPFLEIQKLLKTTKAVKEYFEHTERQLYAQLLLYFKKNMILLFKYYYMYDVSFVS